ncbi:stonustoxin subunit beta-like [Rhinoraja longicauda]
MCDLLQLSALGRPFQLGMLYDCRSDSLIPGITLWDLKTLQSNLDRRDQPSTEIHIISSDSMEKKATALNVSASLKASFLGGLVEVKGSAKYLNDTKESKQQARVTLQYKATTRFEQLTMSQLGRQNITYPTVFDEGSATHVITAVLYGAQAFFVFDQMTSSAENTQDIQGNIEVMINILPKIAIEGAASLQMTDEQSSHAEKLSCTFYGDFSLKNNPTTFRDAMNIYTTLPNLLGPDGEHAVPYTVWLYPLEKLDSKAAQMVREISVGLVSRCQGVLEQLSEAVMRCNDLMKDSIATQFPKIRHGILQFREMCLEYKLVFQGTLARVLPSIRGGGKEEGLLGDILRNMEQSPLKHQALTAWLDDKEWEMMVVGLCLRILKDIPVVKSRRELQEVLMDPATEYVVCFTFTTLHQEDFYLTEAIKYLQSLTAEKMQMSPPAGRACTPQHSERWFQSLSITEKLKERSKLFLDFATANSGDEKVKFLVGSTRDDGNVGASIYLYGGGIVRSSCFEPPSQLKIPAVSGTTHDSATLQLDPPTCGSDEIVGYKVEYRGSQQEKWTILDTPDTSHSFTISGLEPHQEYHFQYRAVTKFGVSKTSETYKVSTRPTNPPGKPVFQDQSPNPTLSWDGPSQIGADVEINQYRIEYREEPSVTSNTEGGLWEQVQTTDTKCYHHLEGLKSDTVYRVRVSADCGEAGSSTASEEVSIKTENVQTGKALKFQSNGRLITKGNPSIYKLNFSLKEGLNPKCHPFLLSRDAAFTNELLQHIRSAIQKGQFNNYEHIVECSYGKPTTTHKMKTIMILGATGSGKTTLINGMINYILGVKWEDNFRYQLIQEETGKSQDESLVHTFTIYHLHHQVGFKIDYSLTIIDTPGFGSKHLCWRDREIIFHTSRFLTFPHGDQIDAICFVVQASLPCLTETQKFVFDTILSRSSKGFAENFQLMVTFADERSPPVLEAFKKANVPYPKDKSDMPVHFKFNNSAIFAQRPTSGNSGEGRSNDSGEEAAMFWKMGENSLKNFFTAQWAQ